MRYIVQTGHNLLPLPSVLLSAFIATASLVYCDCSAQLTKLGIRLCWMHWALIKRVMLASKRPKQQGGRKKAADAAPAKLRKSSRIEGKPRATYADSKLYTHYNMGSCAQGQDCRAPIHNER
jgi:hypothetical protein